MNKKADKKYVVIVGLVLLVLVVVIMLTFTKSWANVTNLLIEKNNCKQSVLAASIDIKGVQFQNKIDCPTKYTLITEKDPEKIKAQIAKSLAYHWDNFGQGKLNIFKKEGKYCVVNEVFDFKEKNKQITGMTRYLFENNVPGTNIRYVDFIAGRSTQMTNYLDDQSIAVKFNQNFDKQSIDTNKKYAIIFSQTVAKDWFSNLKDNAGGAGKASIFAGVLGVGAGGAVVGGICLLVSGGVCVVPMLLYGAVAGGFVGVATFLSGEDPQYVSAIRLIEYDDYSLTTLGCEYLPVEQQTFKK